MALRETANIDRQRSLEDNVEQRLAALLAANAETRRQHALFRTEKERFESETMTRPLTAEKAFAYFGAMLGTFPPAALFGLAIFRGEMWRSGDLWLIGLMAVINLLCGVVGYITGKSIGKIIETIEQMRWLTMIPILSLIGVSWGIFTGGAGGFIFFVIGAFFGAVIAAMVGAVAYPAFGILHRLLQRGGLIETKHFLPIALGVTLAVSAVIIRIN